MEAAPELTAAFAAVRAVSTRFLTASDDELLADMDAVESIGRVVDGMRIAVAAQVEFRSRKILGADSLAFKSGARDGVELVQQTARVTHLVASRRVGLGSALAPATSLLGDSLPGPYPVLADAIAAGEVGVESARVILDTVTAIRKRVTPNDISTMVTALTDTAKVQDTEFLHETAQTWVAFLDPDGAEPRERAQRRTRALRFGRTLADGTTTMTVALIPEHLMMIKEILQSRRRGIHLVRTTPGGDDTCDELDPEWREETGPDGGAPRTRTQHDYDSLIDILEAGMKAQHDGTASTAVTHETVITITADDVENRNGQGFAPGILAGIPIPVIERRACTDDTRLLVTGPKGEVLYLSHAHRLFTAAQKKHSSSSQADGANTPTAESPPHSSKPTTPNGGDAITEKPISTTGSCSAATTTTSSTHPTHPSSSENTTATSTSYPRIGPGTRLNTSGDDTDPRKIRGFGIFRKTRGPHNPSGEIATGGWFRQAQPEGFEARWRSHLNQRAGAKSDG